MMHYDRFPEGRKLVRKLHTMGSLIDPDLYTMGSPIDPDLQAAISFVRSGRVFLPPDASIEELLEALCDEELSIRADAAHRLGEMGEHVPIDPLLEALGDEQRFVRAEAARALGKLVSVPSNGSRKDIDSRSLPRGKVYTPNRNESSGNALGEGFVIPGLVAALHDKDGSVRVAAVEALGMLGNRVSVEDMNPAFSDPWPPVREAAVLALSKWGEQVPLKILLAALRDEDKLVRMAALSVMRTREKQLSIGARGGVQKQVRESALQALVALGKRISIEKPNTVALIIVSTILCTLFLCFRKKWVIPTFGNTSRLLRLPQTLTRKHIKSQKTSTARLSGAIPPKQGENVDERVGTESLP